MLVDIEIDLSTRNGNTRVFITVILTLSSPVIINTETVINRDRLSTWLIVGKLGQGMRCCKCNSNCNVLVCKTQGKVCICMGESVVVIRHTCVSHRFLLSLYRVRSHRIRIRHVVCCMSRSA